MLTWASSPSPDDRICSPPFMELTSLCGDDTMRLLEKNGLAFPFSAYHAQALLAGWPGHGPGGDGGLSVLPGMREGLGRQGGLCSTQRSRVIRWCGRRVLFCRPGSVCPDT